MSEKTIKIVHEGRRKKLCLSGLTFNSLEEKIKQLFDLEDVELVARQKDGTEIQLWDDDDLNMCIATTAVILADKYFEVSCNSHTFHYELSIPTPVVTPILMGLHWLSVDPAH
jgi:hypothetical protein